MDISKIPEFDWIFQVPETQEFAHFLQLTLPLLVRLNEQEFQIHLEHQNLIENKRSEVMSKILDTNLDKSIGKRPETMFYIQQDIDLLQKRIQKYEVLIQNDVDLDEVLVDMELAYRQDMAKLQKLNEIILEKDQILNVEINRVKSIQQEVTPPAQIDLKRFRKDWYHEFKQTVEDLTQDCPELGDEELIQLNVRAEMHRIELESTRIYIESCSNYSIQNQSVDLSQFKSQLKLKLEQMRPIVEQSVRDKLQKPLMFSMYAEQTKTQSVVCKLLTEKSDLMDNINTTIERNSKELAQKNNELQSLKQYLEQMNEKLQDFQKKYDQLTNELKLNQKTNSIFIPTSCKPILDLFGTIN